MSQICSQICRTWPILVVCLISVNMLWMSAEATMLENRVKEIRAITCEIQEDIKTLRGKK